MIDFINPSIDPRLILEISSAQEASSSNIGLYSGKTGMCLIFYNLFSIGNNKKYLNQAEDLLNDVCNSISTVDDLSLSNGLAGIGWAIEYLVQSKMLEANTDEVLESFDDLFYKALVYAEPGPLTLDNGLLGRALFFYRRIQSKNPNRNRFRALCNEECFTLIIQQIQDILNESNLLSGYFSLSRTSMIEISQTLILLCYFYRGYKENKIKTLICSIVNFIRSCFTDKTPAVNQSYFIAYALNRAGEVLNQNDWKDLALNAVKESGFSNQAVLHKHQFSPFAYRELQRLYNVKIDGELSSTYIILKKLNSGITATQPNLNWKEAFGL